MQLVRAASATQSWRPRTAPSTTGFTNSRWLGLKLRSRWTSPPARVRWSHEAPRWYLTSPCPWTPSGRKLDSNSLNTTS